MTISILLLIACCAFCIALSIVCYIGEVKANDRARKDNDRAIRATISLNESDETANGRLLVLKAQSKELERVKAELELARAMNVGGAVQGHGFFILTRRVR